MPLHVYLKEEKETDTKRRKRLGDEKGDWSDRVNRSRVRLQVTQKLEQARKMALPRVLLMF